jgi:hypothetical protein
MAEYDLNRRGGDAMDPRWAEYVRFVGDFYERMGYPGYNPFLNRMPPDPPARFRSRSRSPRPPVRRSRSVSRDSSHQMARTRSHSRDPGSSGARAHRTKSNDKESKKDLKHHKSLSSHDVPLHDLKPSKASKSEKPTSKSVSLSKDRHAKLSSGEKVSSSKLHDKVVHSKKSERKSDGEKTKVAQERKNSRSEECRKLTADVPTEVMKSKEKQQPEEKSKSHDKVIPPLDKKVQSRDSGKVVSRMDVNSSIQDRGIGEKSCGVDEKGSSGATHMLEKRPKEVSAKQPVSKHGDNRKTKSETARKKESKKIPKADVKDGSAVPTSIPLERSSKELAAEAELLKTSSPHHLQLSEHDDVIKPNAVVSETKTSECLEKVATVVNSQVEKVVTSGRTSAERTASELRSSAQATEEKPFLVVSVPEKSRWEHDVDSGSEGERNYQSNGKVRKPSPDRTALPKSVLQSTEDTLHVKPRKTIASVSSVVRSPPPKSSVQLMNSQVHVSHPAGTEAVSSALSDTRKVVHASKEGHVKKKLRHRSERGSTSSQKHLSTSKYRKISSSEQPLPNETNVVTEKLSDKVETDQQAETEKVAAPTHKAASHPSFDDRKVSVIDEDQFEPDYDETDVTADAAEHKHTSSLQRKDSVADDEGAEKKEKSHRGHKRSHRSSDHDDSGTKSKKHKKHKKKKHKSKKEK